MAGFHRDAPPHVLREDKHEVSVIDALGAAPEQMIGDGDIWRLGLTPDEIVARIPKDAQAIGITSMWSYSWPIVRELIKTVKLAFPGVPIVCGGEHFTAVPDLSMAQAPMSWVSSPRMTSSWLRTPETRTSA